MIAMFNGQPIFGPRGPVGPDGNPIGTIISYMGLTAPKDYLVCDGAEYNIADYSELARFFEAQFGSKNHFGGDGTTTFAVPDLRNLFLRGYHGEAAEQLSGNIGEKQEATSHIDIAIGGDRTIYISTPQRDNQMATNVDSVPTTRSDGYGVYSPSANVTGIVSTDRVTYTSRPVNAAVLYCIKAVTSVPAENVYSTEEQIIGRWTDGRPVYGKLCLANNPATGWVLAENVDFIVDATGLVTSNDNSYKIPMYLDGYRNWNLKLSDGIMTARITDFDGYVKLYIKYTKTTD